MITYKIIRYDHSILVQKRKKIDFSITTLGYTNLMKQWTKVSRFTMCDHQNGCFYFFALNFSSLRTHTQFIIQQLSICLNCNWFFFSSIYCQYLHCVRFLKGKFGKNNNFWTHWDIRKPLCFSFFFVGKEAHKPDFFFIKVLFKIAYFHHKLEHKISLL